MQLKTVLLIYTFPSPPPSRPPAPVVFVFIVFRGFLCLVTAALSSERSWEYSWKYYPEFFSEFSSELSSELSSVLCSAEPDNYYYETVECGRRCLLTGALGKGPFYTQLLFSPMSFEKKYIVSRLFSLT